MFYKETNFKETPIGKIPKEWEALSLNDVINTLPGFAFSSKFFNEEKGIPIIRIRDLGKDKTEALYNGPFEEQYVVKEGDVLVSADGEFNVYLWNGPPGLLNQRVIKIWPKNVENLDKLYLYYASQKPLKIFESQVTPTTVKHLLAEHFKLIRIPLPSEIKEQRKIAEVLSTVDEAIRRTDEVIAKTERLKKGLMQTLLTRGIGHKEFKDTEIGRIPRRWEVVMLEKVAEINKESKDPRKEGPNETFHYIDIDSVEEGTGKIRTSKKILGRDAPSRARRVIHENDVIMSTVRPYLKAFAIVPKEYDAQICSTGFAVLSCKNVILPYFLLNVLFWDSTVNQCNRMMVGGQYPALTQSHVSRIKIPLPPLEEQQKIVEILSTVDKKVEIERNEKVHLERIKQGLMDLLLTGKIRVKVN